MNVAQLIAHLQTLPQDKPVLCQVVGQRGGAWNMPFTFVDTSTSYVQLRVEHPDLVRLPMDWPKD